MADDDATGTARLMAEFLEFKAARDAAAAADNDPDNDRDVSLQVGDKVLTLPWRKAKEYDLDGFLESFGLKRKAAPAGKGGDGGAGSSGDPGKTGAQGGGTAPTQLRDYFGGAGKRKAAGGSSAG